MSQVPVSFLPQFQPLFEKDHTFIILEGGRGSMKSWAVARALLIRGTQEPLRILCCRELQNSLADSVLKLLEDQIHTLGLDGFYRVMRDSIIGDNGTEFMFQGLKNDPQKVKGTEGVKIAWVEEAQSVSEESLDTLFPTVFRNAGAQVIFTYNPRFESDPLYRMTLEPPPGTVIIRTSYKDNPYLPQAMIDQAEHMRVTRPLMFRHIWLGEIVPQLGDPLWPQETLDRNRIGPGDAPTLQRIVVAIDPAVTAKAGSDETGIVVAGTTGGKPRHAYVLADLSGRFQPDAWARRALRAYDEFEADAIVAEVNQGGDLVRATVKAVCEAEGRVMPPFKTVRATRGKAVRAEPVAAMYADGLAHHVGRLPVLEDQMLGFDPANPSRRGSPDRVDALVWALHELMGGRQPITMERGIAALYAGAGQARRFGLR